MSNQISLSGNMRRSCFYVCPTCGNIVQSMGEGDFRCCGTPLQKLETQDGSELIKAEYINGENFISLDHPMTKEHYISFLAYVTTDRVYFKKLYPEQSAETSFPRKGLGTVYAYCNQHGMVSVHIK